MSLYPETVIWKNLVVSPDNKCGVPAYGLCLRIPVRIRSTLKVQTTIGERAKNMCFWRAKEAIAKYRGFLLWWAAKFEAFWNAVVDQLGKKERLLNGAASDMGISQQVSRFGSATAPEAPSAVNFQLLSTARKTTPIVGFLRTASRRTSQARRLAR
jgi:hypothetical protein